MKLTVSGTVEQFAAITPRKVSLEGETGDEIDATLKIVPQAKYPFKIVSAKAKDGSNIRLELKEDNSGGGTAYLLHVTNLKTDPGSYRDTIVFETDSELSPQFRVKVSGQIDSPRIAKVVPPNLILRGRSGDRMEVSCQIVPKEGQRFKITDASAEKGNSISFKLKAPEAGDAAAYTVTVKNEKVTRGLYREIIRLKTDSDIQPEIEIPVLLVIN